VPGASRFVNAPPHLRISALLRDRTIAHHEVAPIFPPEAYASW